MKNIKAKRIIKHTNPTKTVDTDDPLIKWAVDCVSAGKSERGTIVSKATTDVPKMKMANWKDSLSNASLRKDVDLEDAQGTLSTNVISSDPYDKNFVISNPSRSVVHCTTNEGILNLSNLGALNLSNEELELP